MSIRTVLIPGARHRRPDAGHWLHRRGYQVTVIGRAPRLRDWGSAVDFRGRQMDILVRIGILDEAGARQTGMGEQVMVDERDRPLAARRRAARRVRPASRAVASRATTARAEQPFRCGWNPHPERPAKRHNGGYTRGCSQLVGHVL
jgi:hypothetical protein